MQAKFQGRTNRGEERQEYSDVEAKTTPEPAHEEEERSGDDDWVTDEEEDGDLEGKREQERLEMEREREELEREAELEKEVEKEEEEWERGGEEIYDEETGQPYPYPPQYFFLKVRTWGPNLIMWVQWNNFMLLLETLDTLYTAVKTPPQKNIHNFEINQPPPSGLHDGSHASSCSLVPFRHSPAGQISTFLNQSYRSQHIENWLLEINKKVSKVFTCLLTRIPFAPKTFQKVLWRTFQQELSVSEN